MDEAVRVGLAVRQPALPEPPRAQLVGVVGGPLSFGVDVGVVVVDPHPRRHVGRAEPGVGSGGELHGAPGVVASLPFQDFAGLGQSRGVVPVELLAFLPEVDGFNVLVFLRYIPGFRQLLEILIQHISIKSILGY